MNKESNIFKNTITVLLALLILALAAGTMSASTPAGTGADVGINVTINATSATGFPALLNTTAGARINVSFNNTNATATTWYINATNLSVSINGSGSPNGTIAANGTFTLNSSVPTGFFNVTVSNADNSSENATLTGFRFVATVDLGTAANFAILAGTAITGADPSNITGDVGLSPGGGASITVLACVDIITGTIYDNNGGYAGGRNVGSTTCRVTDAAKLTTAKNDLSAAYNDTAGRTSVTIANALGGQTLTPGVYDGGALDLATGTTLTLNAQGDTNAVFIIKAASSLDTAAGSLVNLTNGANASNVFWQVGTTATLQDGTKFNGTILAKTSIVLVTAPNVKGRLLAWNGAVTLGAGSVVTNPSSSVLYGVNLTNVSALANTTTAGVNATYYLNLTNNGTSADSYTITVANPNNAFYAATNISTTATLAANASTVFTLNVTNTTAGTVYVNVTARSINNVSVFGYINTTTTITGSVYGVNLTNVSALANTTTAGVNATYYLNLTNNGTFAESYTITVANPNNAFYAATNISTATLAANASKVFTLNVTNTTAGTVYVNVTARSNNDTTKFGYINTTTNITGSVYGVNLTNVTALANTTTAGVNATYYLNLTNNGSFADTYTITVANPNNAYYAATNISTATLAANASKVFTLNVTNTTAGTVYVNVTARSNNDTTKFGYINTTTNITGSAYGVNLTVDSNSRTTTATINASYALVLHNNGSVTDSYNLTVVNTNNASTAALNITVNITLAQGASQALILNVTNTTAGTFRVNVTARSNNDTTRFGYINTTTVIGTGNGSVQAVNLGTAGNFVILSKSGITNVPTSAITGDIGTSPIAGTAITGIDCAEVTGTIYTVNDAGPACRVVDPVRLTAAVSDMETAYTAAAAPAPDVTELGAGNIGGMTLVPGVYKWGTGVTIPTDVTLSGNSTGVWIFQIAQTLDISSGKQVILSGGALAKNVFWQVAGTTTLGTTSVFNGNILDATNIRIQTGATLNGRALAQTAVTLEQNTVTVPAADIVLNGTLRGTYIKSGTSIAVSGASVNITNTSTGVSVIKTTDASGAYSVSLYPGNYSINVSKTGYSSNSTTATVVTGITKTVPTIPLSVNTVTVTANRTLGTAETGQNVSFNLTVVNTGDNATFSVATSVTNISTNVTNITTPSPLLLNTSTSTGYVVVTVNNSNFGGWPVTITISNSSQSKSASVTLNAIMRNASAPYTNISSTVTTGATVTGATLVNATVQNGANVSGNSTLISNATITGSGTTITDGAVIKGDYGDSYISNSSVGNATVVSSNLTSSTTISNNASVTNSTLVGATVSNSTLTNVTVSAASTITNVANLANITLAGVTVTGDPSYDYEGKISGGTGWATYQGINFTKVYTDVRISQLVIEQSSNQNVASGANISINDTSLGTSMNFSMTVNLTRGMVINISETGISPDGAALPSGTQLGNFLVIRSNDTNASNVTSNTLRLYFDTAPSTYSGGVAIYYYNTTAATPAWEALITTASGTEGGRYYREAAPNHFSTFALLGTVTSTPSTPSTSGGSSGSTGGGGIVTSEPYTNIEKSERYDKSLIANTPVTYTFKVPELGIYEIAITGKESENDIALRVELLKGTSKQVTVPAPGNVYKNINILAGTKRIKEVLIRFKVENSWLTGNNFAGSDVKLVKWDGSKWVQLETSEKTKDVSFTYFEAKTDTFSVFAITGLKGGVIVPTATPAGAVTVTETPVKPTGTATAAPTPVPTKKKVPGFELVLVAAAFCSVYLFSRKRR